MSHKDSLAGLNATSGPWLHSLTATPSNTCDALWAWERSAPGHVVRFAHGKKARSLDAFYDEFAAALQFPYYFGENWDAYHDCLSDLSWLAGQAVTICVTDAVLLLDHAPIEALRQFMAVAEQAARHFQHPTRNRPVQPFHLVLQAEPGQETALERRYHGLGALSRLVLPTVG